MCEWCPARPLVNTGIVTCSVCGTDQAVLAFEVVARATCIHAVKMGRSFSCERVEDGWYFAFYEPSLPRVGAAPPPSAP